MTESPRDIISDAIEDKPYGVASQFTASELAVAIYAKRPDLTYTDIAKILGVSVTTVSRAIKRAAKPKRKGSA